MNKNEPVFFKKLPKTEETKPNALYIRPMGTLPVHGEVHEIEWRSDRWTVRREEFFTPQEALVEMCRQNQKQIDAVKSTIAPNVNAVESIAQVLGVSVGTLRRRMKLIQNHLPKTA